MTDSALEALLRRDRYVVSAALIALTLLAWTYVLWLAATMDMSASHASSMPGMDMSNMPGMGPAIKDWSLTDFVFTFAMWTVMMVGMMTPSAAPMILLYARVGRQAAVQGKPFASTGWFAGGYLAAWTAFALVASAAQDLLVRAALLTPMLASTNRIFGGIILLAAGIYQWSPIKEACLTNCRGPLQFIQQHGGFKRDAAGALGLGLRHGLYCIGCCWALMALLFVGGVMNVIWIATLSAVVLLEKIAPGGRFLARGLGLVLVAAGLILIYQGAKM